MTDSILHGTSHLIVALRLGLRESYEIATRQSHSNRWRPIFTTESYLFTVEGTEIPFEGGASKSRVRGEEIIEKAIKASSSTITNGGDEEKTISLRSHFCSGIYRSLINFT